MLGIDKSLIEKSYNGDLPSVKLVWTINFNNRRNACNK